MGQLCSMRDQGVDIKDTGSEEGGTFSSSHPSSSTKGGKAGGQGRKVSETHTASRLLHRPALLCHVGEGALMWNPLPWASS